MEFRHTTNVNGTRLQGYVRTTFNKLIEVFDAPNIGKGDKTNAEWGLRFADGTIATIYDWKEALIPTKEYAWHIGGHDSNAVKRVCSTLGVLPVHSNF